MKKIVYSTTLLALLVGCSATDNQPVAQIEPGVPLKTLAKEVKLNMGAAIATHHLDDGAFQKTLIANFNQITPENEMKWEIIHPEKDRFDFSKGDQLVDFAQAHDMIVKGHTLVWHIQNPAWLTQNEWTKQELSDILENHIKTVVGHYKGKVQYWDVVNEAFNDNGTYRETIWYKTLGEEYIELAFKWAHEADPDAKLFYNDYSTEGMGPKSNAVYRKIVELKNKGVPIDGVGTQLHLEASNPVSDASVAKNIERLKDEGLQVHFTEVDVRVADNATAAQLQDQAEQYKKLMDLAIYYPEVDMFTTWGVGDKYSWVPSWFSGFGRALLFDESFRPKLAYQEVQASLSDAATGQFTYVPPVLETLGQRYVQPFIANPLSSDSFANDKVIFYPFNYNQLENKDQRFSASDDISGKWAIGYHNNKLIGKVLRQDDITVTNNNQVHENDNIEVFVSRGSVFWQLRTTVGEPFADNNFPGKVVSSWNDEGTEFNFTLEFDGVKDLVAETMGFNIALSDNDNTDPDGTRETQVYPITGTNLGWQGEEFGELFMTGQNAVVSSKPVSAPPQFNVIKLNAAPQSANDSQWSDAYQYSLAYNQLNQSDMVVNDASDISGDWTLGYHDKWVYGVVHRVDDVTYTSDKESYLNDNVELFIQSGGDSFTQFRTVVGQDFEKTNYPNQYFAKWSDDGSTLFFGIEMDEAIKSGDSINWNIGLSDNDGSKRKYQLYPLSGSNRSYIGEGLTKVKMK